MPAFVKLKKARSTALSRTARRSQHSLRGKIAKLLGPAHRVRLRTLYCCGPYTEDVKSSCILALILVLTSCAGRRPSFESVAEEFVFGSLALSPVSATQSGYHRHQGT